MTPLQSSRRLLLRYSICKQPIHHSPEGPRRGLSTWGRKARWSSPTAPKIRFWKWHHIATQQSGRKGARKWINAFKKRMRTEAFRSLPDWATPCHWFWSLSVAARTLSRLAIASHHADTLKNLTNNLRRSRKQSIKRIGLKESKLPVFLIKWQSAAACDTA